MNKRRSNFSQNQRVKKIRPEINTEITKYDQTKIIKVMTGLNLHENNPINQYRKHMIFKIKERIRRNHLRDTGKVLSESNIPEIRTLLSTSKQNEVCIGLPDYTYENDLQITNVFFLKDIYNRAQRALFYIIRIDDEILHKSNIYKYMKEIEKKRLIELSRSAIQNEAPNYEEYLYYTLFYSSEIEKKYFQDNVNVGKENDKNTKEKKYVMNHMSKIQTTESEEEEEEEHDPTQKGIKDLDGRIKKIYKEGNEWRIILLINPPEEYKQQRREIESEIEEVITGGYVTSICMGKTDYERYKYKWTMNYGSSSKSNLENEYIDEGGFGFKILHREQHCLKIGISCTNDEIKRQRREIEQKIRNELHNSDMYFYTFVALNQTI